MKVLMELQGGIRFPPSGLEVSFPPPVDTRCLSEKSLQTFREAQGSGGAGVGGGV